MTRLTKRLLALCLACASASASASALDDVLQHGFPQQQADLKRTTAALEAEYQQQHHVVQLMFYAFGMLRLADGYKAMNDYVNASEYSKLGFFWLDEAVDSHEDNLRVRYLRARVDAYLPAALGRCVVTLADTERLNKATAVFDEEAMAQIAYMRYRALLSCQQPNQAAAVKKAMQEAGPVDRALLAQSNDSVPPWTVNELTHVIMPLLQGE